MDSGSGTVDTTTDNLPAQNATGWYRFNPGVSQTTQLTTIPTTSSGSGFFVEPVGGATGFPAGNWNFTVVTDIPDATLTAGTAVLTVGLWKGTLAGGTWTPTQTILTPTDDPAAQNLRTTVANKTTTVTFSLPAFSIAAGETLFVDFWRHQTGGINTATATRRQLDFYVNNGSSFITHPAADDAGPTHSLSVAELTNPGGQYFNAGTGTLYYNTAAGGTFRVSNAATDAGSGVASVTFPGLAATGFTHTAITDTTSAYQSNTYTWTTANTTSPGSQAVSAVDNALNSSNPSPQLTLTRDVTAPSGQTLALVGGPYYTSTSVSLTAGDGSDAGAGLDTSSRLYERDSATLTNGICGAFSGSWTTVANPDATVVSGNCYRYRFSIADNVSNRSATVTASVDAKVDTSAPSSTVTFPASAGTYNTAGWNAGCATNGFCGTHSDTGSGVQGVQVSIRQGAANYWNGTSFASGTEVWNTATLAGGNWSLTFPAASFPADGSYTVRVRATDAAGNVETPSTRSFTIDRDEPETTINSNPTNPTASNSATFSFTSTRAVRPSSAASTAAPGAPAPAPPTTRASPTAATPSTSAPPTSPATRTARLPPTPGWSTRRRRPRRPPSRWRAASTTRPAGPQAAGPPGSAGPTRTAPARASPRCRSPSARARVTTGTARASRAPPRSGTRPPSAAATGRTRFAAGSFPADGSYTVRVRAVDAVANTETPSTRTFTYDTTNPSALFTFPASGGNYTTTTWNAGCGTNGFCGTHSDAGSGVQAVAGLDPARLDRPLLERDVVRLRRPSPSRPRRSRAATGRSPSPPRASRPTASTRSTCARETTRRTPRPALRAPSGSTTRPRPRPSPSRPRPARTTPPVGTRAARPTGSAAPTPTRGSGVQGVEVSIRQGAGNYWNGTSFASGTEVWNTATLAGGNWSLTFPAASFPADGSYTVRVRATDAAGNVETPSTRTFTHRPRRPADDDRLQPDEPERLDERTFTFSSSEGGSTFECRLDGGAWGACTSPRNYTSLADGSHTFDVRATDVAGNTDASPASYTWLVDTTAPSSTVPSRPTPAPTTPPAGTPAAAPTASAAPTADGSGSGVAQVQVSIRQGAGNYWNGTGFASGTEVWNTATLAGGNWSLAFPAATFPADGSYTVRVRAVDAVGQHRDSVEPDLHDRPHRAADHDRLQPGEPDELDVGCLHVLLERGQLHLRVPDRRRRLGRLHQPAQLHQPRRRQPHLRRARHRRRRQHRRLPRLLHLARRHDGPDARRRPSRPPSASYTAAEWTAGCATAGLCGTYADGAGAGVASVEVSIRRGTGNYWNGTSFASGTEVWNTASLAGGNWSLAFAAGSFPADGNYTVRVRATDAVGNVESPSSRTFEVDQTAPSTTVSFPAAAGTYNAAGWAAGCATAGLCGTYTDATSGVASVEVSIRRGSGNYWNGSGFSSASEVWNTATLAAGNWSYAFAAASFPADGGYTVRVRGNDVAGNAEAASSRTFTYDTTAPQTTIDSNPSDPTSATGGRLRLLLETRAARRSSAASTAAPGAPAPARRATPASATAATPSRCAPPTSPATPTPPPPPTPGSSTPPRPPRPSPSPPPPRATPPPSGTPAAPPPASAAPTPTAPAPASPRSKSPSARAPATTGTARGFASATEVWNDATLAAGDWTYDLDSTDFPADGDYTVRVRARDAVGNTETASSRTFELDKTDPSSAIAFPAAAGLYNVASWDAGCTVAGLCGTYFDGTSGVAQVEVSIRHDGGDYWDGSGFTSATEVWHDATFAAGDWSYAFDAANLPVDGDYAVRVRARDAAGNVESASSRTFTFDSSEPETSIDSSMPDPTNQTSASFDFSADEPGATFECAIDGGAWGACTSPKAYVGLLDGGHTFEVRATDPAGNTDGNPAAFNWTIDTVAPSTTASFPAAAGSYTAAEWDAGCATPGLCGTYSDTGVGVVDVEVSIRRGTGNYWDGAGFASATEVWNDATFAAGDWAYDLDSTDFPADGDYTVRVRARDDAGNTETPSALTFTYDATAPASTVAFPASGGTYNAAGWDTGCTAAGLCGTYSDATSGVAEIEVSIRRGTGNYWDGAGFASATEVWNDATFAAGNWSYALDSADLPADGALHRARPRPRRRRQHRDGLQPHLHLRHQRAADQHRRQPDRPDRLRRRRVRVLRQRGRLDLRVPASTAAPGAACTSPQTYTSLADGSHTFHVRATDVAGNTDASPASFTWLIDTTAPSSTIAFPAAAGEYNTAGWNAGCPTAGLCGTYGDGSGAGVAEVEVSIRQGSGNYWNGTAFAERDRGLERRRPRRRRLGLRPRRGRPPGGRLLHRARARPRLVGNTEAASSRTFTYDTNDPSATFAFPAAGGEYSTAGWNAGCATVGFCGPQSDGGSGVADVEISVRRVSDGLYWDGDSFDAGAESYFTATLGGGNWSYAFPAASFPADGQYVVHVRATDDAGNTESGPSRTFRIDNTDPSALFTFPNAGTRYSTSGWNAGCPAAGVCGSYSDGGSGVAQVEVSVKRNSTDLYWDGDSFDAGAETYFTATLSGGDWSLAFPAANFPADGGYTLHVRATDDAGNVEGGPTRTFIYDTTRAADEHRRQPDRPDGRRTTPSSSSPPARPAPPSSAASTAAPGAPAPARRPTRASATAATPSRCAPPTRPATPTAPPPPTPGSSTPTAPSSTIAFPTAAGEYNTAGWNAGCPTSGLCGTYADGTGSGVDQVQVSVQRDSTGLYWNGAAFSSAGEVLLGTSLSGGEWSRPFPASNFPADGGYTVRVFATDEVGNAEAPATRDLQLRRDRPDRLAHGSGRRRGPARRGSHGLLRLGRRRLRRRHRRVPAAPRRRQPLDDHRHRHQRALLDQLEHHQPHRRRLRPPRPHHRRGRQHLRLPHPHRHRRQHGAERGDPRHASGRDPQRPGAHRLGHGRDLRGRVALLLLLRGHVVHAVDADRLLDDRPGLQRHVDGPACRRRRARPRARHRPRRQHARLRDPGRRRRQHEPHGIAHRPGRCRSARRRLRDRLLRLGRRRLRRRHRRVPAAPRRRQPLDDHRHRHQRALLRPAGTPPASPTATTTSASSPPTRPATPSPPPPAPSPSTTTPRPSPSPPRPASSTPRRRIRSPSPPRRPTATSRTSSSSAARTRARAAPAAPGSPWASTRARRTRPPGRSTPTATVLCARSPPTEPATRAPTSST